MSTIAIIGPYLHDSFSGNNETHRIEDTGFSYSNDSKPALTTAAFTNLVLDNYGMIGNTNLGNDTLIGGKGNDKLHDGYDNDVLTGGGGHDRFCFDSFPVNSLSHITDFAPGVDHIMLSHGYFHALSDAGHVLSPSMFHIGHSFSANDQRIDYNPGNGWLTYDSNGSAAGGDPIHFATLGPHLTLHSSDFTVIA